MALPFLALCLLPIAAMGQSFGDGQSTGFGEPVFDTCSSCNMMKGYGTQDRRPDWIRPNDKVITVDCFGGAYATVEDDRRIVEKCRETGEYRVPYYQ